MASQPTSNGTSRVQRVAVVGASSDPDRYSNRAVRLLREHGHEAIPVTPRETQVEGLPVIASLADVSGPIDTVTLYVSAKRSTPMEADFLKLRPGRVIFNPGAENPALQEVLARHGIQSENACTLILLNTGQF